MFRSRFLKRETFSIDINPSNRFSNGKRPRRSILLIYFDIENFQQISRSFYGFSIISFLASARDVDDTDGCGKKKHGCENS